MDVEFEARMRVLLVEIDVAGRNLEMAMDEMDQPMREIPREVRAVVRGAVLLQTARDVNSREPFCGQFDVRVSLVVPKKNVIARLPLLDQVVFKREGFFFVVDLNEVDLTGFVDQRACFRVGKTVVVEI